MWDVRKPSCALQERNTLRQITCGAWLPSGLACIVGQLSQHKMKFVWLSP
jgi:hypothetical protein